MDDEPDHLVLKWGTLKAWKFSDEKTQGLLQQFYDLGIAYEAMQQKMTPEHKDVLCQIIDSVNADTIGNDWSGENMTKEQAKAYVMGYRA